MLNEDRLIGELGEEQTRELTEMLRTVIGSFEKISKEV